MSEWRQTETVRRRVRTLAKEYAGSARLGAVFDDSLTAELCRMRIKRRIVREFSGLTMRQADAVVSVELKP